MKISDPAKIVWHLLRIRTAAGDEWEPACQFIISPLLALRTAKVLHNFLLGDPAAQEGVPQWALDIRDAIAEDGTDTTQCSVVVNRGGPGRWKVMAVLTGPTTAKVPVARRGRKRVG